MQLQNKFNFSAPAPLRSKYVSRIDTAFVYLAHLTLLFTWLAFFVGIPTIFGLAIALTFVFLLRIRGNSITLPARKLILSRILIGLICTLSFGGISHFQALNAQDTVFMPHRAWFLLSYILAGLATYDLYWISKGFEGFPILKTIKRKL